MTQPSLLILRERLLRPANGICVYKQVERWCNKIYPEIRSQYGMIKLDNTDFHYLGFSVGDLSEYGFELDVHLSSAPVEDGYGYLMSNTTTEIFWLPYDLIEIGLPKSYKTYNNYIEMLKI